MKKPLSRQRSREDQVRLLAELEAPYRGVRKFIYGAVAVSGGLGAFVFLFRVLAGRELNESIPNLLLQMGVLVGAISLIRLENRWGKRDQTRIRSGLEAQDPHVPPAI